MAADIRFCALINAVNLKFAQFLIQNYIYIPLLNKKLNNLKYSTLLFY